MANERKVLPPTGTAYTIAFDYGAGHIELAHWAAMTRSECTNSIKFGLGPGVKRATVIECKLVPVDRVLPFPLQAEGADDGE